jgi:hypothetical protein
MSSIMSGVQWYLLRSAGFRRNGTSSRRHIRLNVHGVVSNAFAASPMNRMFLYSDAGFCFLVVIFSLLHMMLCTIIYVIHRRPLGSVQRRHGFIFALGGHSRCIDTEQ